MRGAQPWRTNRARTLRANSVRAEDLLWAKLRNRQLGGHKFVRQAPVGTYYVDFLCRLQKVIVEIDGATHGTDEEIKSDIDRDTDLGKRGYRVFRVANDDVYQNIDGVLDTLLDFMTGGET